LQITCELTANFQEWDRIGLRGKEKLNRKVELKQELGGEAWA
jgi:hypothetical protein